MEKCLNNAYDIIFKIHKEKITYVCTRFPLICHILNILVEYNIHIH